MRATPMALALAAAFLAGCGSEQEAYCDAVEERQAELTEIATAAEPGAVFDVLPIYQELADEAPTDLRDEWRLVVGRLTTLQEAFVDAEVDPATYDPENPPEGLSRADRTAISRAAADLVAPDTQDAMGGIEQHARDVCKTELGGAPLGG